MCTFVSVHVQHAASVYGRRPTGSLGESVLTPAPCDPVQEASGHSPSEPLSSKSDPDEGTARPRPWLEASVHAQKSQRCARSPVNTCASERVAGPWLRSV